MPLARRDRINPEPERGKLSTFQCCECWRLRSALAGLAGRVWAGVLEHQHYLCAGLVPFPSNDAAALLLAAAESGKLPSN